MEKIKTDKKSLRKFGLTMAIAFLVISLIILFRHRHSVIPTASVSILFFVFAFAAPSALGPVYRIWMKFASILGWVNTRILLIIIFYIIFTPIGIIMRLLGTDPLNRKIEKNKFTYWIKKERSEADLSGYERRF